MPPPTTPSRSPASRSRSCRARRTGCAASRSASIRPSSAASTCASTSTSGGKVTSRLTVERAETLDLLRRDAPQLERALQHAGLNTEGGLRVLAARPELRQPRSDPARRARDPLDRPGRRAGRRRGGPARLRPADRARRRRRHQGVRTRPWLTRLHRSQLRSISATGTAPSTDLGRRRSAPRPTRRRSRSNFNTFLHAADHAIEEPEPARAARHQPVHPAAGAVRRRRAADQHEPAAHLAGHLQKATQTTSAMSFLGSTATVDGTTTQACERRSATWTFAVDKPSTATITIKDATGATRLQRQLPAQCRARRTSTGTAAATTARKWPDGDYTLSVTAKDASGHSVAVSTEVTGTVDSVDLTPEPAGAHDRRADLHARQDQAGRAAGPVTSRRWGEAISRRPRPQSAAPR